MTISAAVMAPNPMTRTGKIARLPREVREELNHRLEDGEEGMRLVAWLNARADVQAVLAVSFGGRAINEQNLTEWKQGGFQDWLHHQESRAWLNGLVEEAAELSEEAGDVPVTDRLSGLLAVALGRCAQQAALLSTNDPGQQKVLLAVAHELTILRRCDHAEQRLRVERQDRELKLAKESEQKRLNAESAARVQARMKIHYPHLFQEAESLSLGPIPLELHGIALEIANKAWARETNAAGTTPPVQTQSK